MSSYGIGWRLPALCLCLCSALLLGGTPRDAAAAEHRDSDVDGLLDEWEVSIFGTDPSKLDTDGDGYADREEVLHEYDPLAPKKKRAPKDFDKDGLNDRLELLFGTDPMQADTDGDSFQDGLEVEMAYSPTSTEAIPLEKSLHIILSTQRMERRVMGIAIASSPVSSGLAKTPTPVGTFKVLDKHPRAWSRSAKLWMPYWMHFSGRGHGIHELPEWPGGRKEGASHLGRPASHGCVRLGVGAAKTAYEWAPVGTKVVIVKTPPKTVMLAIK